MCVKVEPGRISPTLWWNLKLFLIFHKFFFFCEFPNKWGNFLTLGNWESIFYFCPNLCWSPRLLFTWMTKIRFQNFSFLSSSLILGYYHCTTSMLPCSLLYGVFSRDCPCHSWTVAPEVFSQCWLGVSIPT